MKQVMVNIEISLFEDIIKMIANAVHPISGGQIHQYLTHLMSIRDNAFKESQSEMKNAS